MKEEEEILVSQFAQENLSMLKVNWTRLYRCYGFVPKSLEFESEYNKKNRELRRKIEEEAKNMTG